MVPVDLVVGHGTSNVYTPGSAYESVIPMTGASPRPMTAAVIPCTNNYTGGQ